MVYIAKEDVMCLVVYKGYGYIIKEGCTIKSQNICCDHQECYIKHGNDKLNISRKVFNECFEEV